MLDLRRLITWPCNRMKILIIKIMKYGIIVNNRKTKEYIKKRESFETNNSYYLSSLGIYRHSFVSYLFCFGHIWHPLIRSWKQRQQSFRIISKPYPRSCSISFRN